jgi:hypothetical protein
VRLPNGYNPALNDRMDVTTLAGAFSPTAVCYTTKRHRVSIRTGTNTFFQAANAGGSTLNAAAPGPGVWEQFFLIDINGGYLMHDDAISLRTTQGSFIRVSSSVGGLVSADAASDSSSSARFIIKRFPAGGPINAGDTFMLLSVSRARYVTAINNGGGNLVSDQPNPQAWEQFTLEDPRRAHLVYLRNTEVSGSAATSSGWDKVISARLTDNVLFQRFKTGAGNPIHPEEAFWVYDHNGGLLMSGDQISFETGRPETIFMSTCSSGTSGNVRGDSWFANNCSRFTITREAGPGEIVHSDRIFLRSVGQNRFLTWVPGNFPDVAQRNRLRNDASFAGSTERFRIEAVQGTAFTVR